MIRSEAIRPSCSLLAAASVMALVASHAKPQSVGASDAPGSAPQARTDAAGRKSSRKAPIRYRITDLGTLGGTSFGAAINSSGQIVGHTVRRATLA